MCCPKWGKTKEGGSKLRKMKHRMQGAVFWVLAGLLSGFLAVCGGGMPAAAELMTEEAAAAKAITAEVLTETEVAYKVSFVDAEDVNTDIFYPQEGTVQEGTTLQISFPEQIIGSDGHIWNSLAESPQEFLVYQYGVHKYFIEYQQGEKVKELEEAKKDGEDTLNAWLLKAWKADCAITGQSPEEVQTPYLVGENQQAQDQRIRQLVSRIADGEWHTFYLIGKNHVPQTVSLGVQFDAVYSSRKAERFSVEEDWYQVVEVRVKRNWTPETCTHRWELVSRESEGCLKVGAELWQCVLCQAEEEVRLAALGHQDPDESGSCILCGTLLDDAAMEETGEVIRWKEGEAQLRTLGNTVYRFVCVDEDYSDGQELHRTAALFLCDSVIRSDADSDSTVHQTFSFGENNNYKTSFARNWLKEQSAGAEFQMEPVSVGVCSAYTGSTETKSYEQLEESALKRHEIPYQWMTDRVFLLSLEEALRYREVLWSFGTGMKEGAGPESQISAYSQGYYLRTPYFTEAEDGSYTDGSRIYGVDLVNGNIHPVEAGNETYGLRPAFALPQG